MERTNFLELAEIYVFCRSAIEFMAVVVFRKISMIPQVCGLD